MCPLRQECTLRFKFRILKSFLCSLIFSLIVIVQTMRVSTQRTFIYIRLSRRAAFLPGFRPVANANRINPIHVTTIYFFFENKFHKNQSEDLNSMKYFQIPWSMRFLYKFNIFYFISDSDIFCSFSLLKISDDFYIES